MNQINIATKKFTDAVKIDIGQLPVTDVKIDFNLTDGSKPVIAENKTFSMTIGTVNGELYKTDDDTVSFRYLKFNDNNVANSLAITMKMNGEEILNDTVSLTYQTSGGSSVTVDSEMSESSPNPVANSTITQAINNKADKATTIAGYGITDAYTKTEIDAKVSSVYRYRGTVSAYADLPSSGQEIGDVYNVETADSTHGIKAGDNVAWTGTEWDVLAGEIDLSAYATKTELETKMDAPATGTIGQVLTKTADGQEWADAQGGGGEDATDYLCFTAEQANSTVRLDKLGTPSTINLEYSTDKQTWTEYTWSGNTGAAITLANIGDSVWWRGNNTAFSLDDSNLYHFAMSGSIEASGNVMSLLDKTFKSVTIPTAYCFYALFTTCSSLREAPELPATTLANNCYHGMFSDCSSLTKAPELPATTLAQYCYESMFNGCWGLTKAPELPATTLANSCYHGMFNGCFSLTEAPELPATNLTYDCYSTMFLGCSSINKIKVNFTDWMEYDYPTSSWFSGASSTGVFECPSALDCSTRDNSHVPAGWTIVRTDSPKSITSPTTVSSEATYQVSPNTPSVPVVTVSSALTLNASTVDNGSVAYSEVVLDVATGATVTAGTNLTLVDTPTAGKRNICVCRWSGGVCKLYVTIVEDLPQA